MDPYQKNLVSIITPVYNAGKFIAETIECIQAQTYVDWELLLINDCSQDNSVQQIEHYMQADSRIRLIHLETNSGAAVARNKGIEQAKGQYIAFVDSDDCWEPRKLELQLAYMQQHGVAFTYTNFKLLNEDGSVRKERMKLPTSRDYYGLLKNTAIACSTVVIDRNIIGDFRMPLVRKGQDTATWLMLMRERGVTAYLVDEVLNGYRQVKGSLSNNKFKALQRTWYIYRELEKLPLLKSAYYFVNYAIQATLRRL